MASARRAERLGSDSPTTAPNLPAVAPLERTGNFKERAYRQIKSQIVSGRLKADVVYSTSQFADMLQVSRSPVRDALLELAAEGYLVLIDGRGFKLRQFSAKEIADIFEARIVMETYVVGQLAGKLTADDLRRLKNNVAVMVQRADAGDPAGFLEADKEFHMILVRLYQNERILAIMDNLRTVVCLVGLQALAHVGRIQEVIAEHTRILTALSRRDPKAAVAAMREHLRATARYLTADHAVTPSGRSAPTNL